MKTKFFVFFQFLVSSFLFLIAVPANAAINNPVLENGDAPVADPTGYFNSVLQTVVSIFFIVGVIYFAWHLLFAGYHFIATEGDPKRYEMAKQEIIHSLIGIVAIFSVFAIIKLIGIVFGITGLDGLSLPLPTI